jgi:hypothetical protein
MVCSARWVCGRSVRAALEDVVMGYYAMVASGVALYLGAGILIATFLPSDDPDSFSCDEMDAFVVTVTVLFWPVGVAFLLAHVVACFLFGVLMIVGHALLATVDWLDR